LNTKSSATVNQLLWYLPAQMIFHISCITFLITKGFLEQTNKLPTNIPIFTKKLYLCSMMRV